MDTRLLHLYERELRYMRELGGEFARDFPKVAGRLGLETYACADPYVERLLEGFSFLAARVHLKIEAEFPRFTSHLLELVYPQYLAPTPSMAIVQMQPNLHEGSLGAGVRIERDTSLRSLLGKHDATSCEYRTAQPVTLWPLELAEAKYFTYAGELGGVDLSRLGPVKAGLRLRLKACAGLTIREIALDTLELYLRGSDALPANLLEQLLGHAVGMVVMPVLQPGAKAASWHQMLPKSGIRQACFDDDRALLPPTQRAFSGYRLLQEYFAFPQRFMFAQLRGLQAGLRHCSDKEVDVVVLFDQAHPLLEQGISASNLALYCTPAINLFPKRADRIHLSDRETEYHLVPDRTRPMDFEVCQVLGVTGYGAGVEAVQRFEPFYRANDLPDAGGQRAYFQLRRQRRVLSEQQRRKGPRSSYVGTEVFLSLVDAHEAPYASSLRQLGVETLCSNRDLPLSMPLGGAKTDFTLEISAPVQAVRCITGPTAPAPSHAEGELAWRLVSHLSLNYLSLMDGAGVAGQSAGGESQGGAALKELLRLYCQGADPASLRQVDAIRSVLAVPVTARLPVTGPICFGRGLQVQLTVDDAALEGQGVFLLGAVLEQFFARYAHINSFTETVLSTERRGMVMKWPARGGLCKIL